MPKDEVDPDDPMELAGVAIDVEDEREMVLAIVDEYVRMGYCRDDVVALFAEPSYALTHEVWKRRGEAFVRACVDHVLDRWTIRDC